jgi:ketosteroid isomerase-like protein
MNLEIEIQIREGEERLYAAMLASDVKELDTLIADDLLFVGPTGELVTKAMDLELHRTGGTKFTELVPMELEIQILSDRFVLTTTKVFLSGTYLGNAFSADYRYLRIWHKGDQDWKIAGGSVNAVVY